MSSPRIRTGKYKALLKEPNGAVVAELRKATPEDFDRRMIVFLNVIQRQIKQLTEYLSLTSEYIVEAARGRGIRLTPRAVACHTKRCATCLGKYALHFPYLYDENKRRFIRTRDLRDFLAGLGLPEEKIDLFLDAIDARHLLIQLHNNIVRIYSHFGLTRVRMA